MGKLKWEWYTVTDNSTYTIASAIAASGGYDLVLDAYS